MEKREINEGKKSYQFKFLTIEIWIDQQHG